MENTEKRGKIRNFLSKTEDTLNTGMRGKNIRWGLLVLIGCAIAAMTMFIRSVLFFFN